MIHLRKSSDRGYADHGWLKSFHSFSFANYHDPDFMGWGNLRVINEDRIAPGMGFGTHGHRDMEILTYVLSGELAHKDSLGNTETIPPGDVQRMSAGSGITHSEFNHAQGEETHLLQIWLLPSRRDLAPGYEQRAIREEDKRGRLLRIAAPFGSGGVVSLNADASIYAGLFDTGEQAELELAPGRKGYVHLVRGNLVANGIAMSAGDALMVDDERWLHVEKGKETEVLVFDLAPL